MCKKRKKTSLPCKWEPNSFSSIHQLLLVTHFLDYLKAWFILYFLRVLLDILLTCFTVLSRCSCKACALILTNQVVTCTIVLTWIALTFINIWKSMVTTRVDITKKSFRLSTALASNDEREKDSVHPVVYRYQKITQRIQKKSVLACLESYPKIWILWKNGI